MRGLAAILFGILAFIWPGITALAFVMLIASWAILTGVLEIVAGVQLRHVIRNEWLLILSGVLSVVFGILLFLQPAAGALSLVWMIGLYAVVFGIDMLALAWRLHGLLERMPKLPTGAAQARPA